MPRKGLSPRHYNRSKIKHLALSEIDALYQANVPVSIVKMTRHSAPVEHHRPSALLSRARRRKEQFGQANFDPDILLKSAGRLEVVKHVAGYCEIRSDRDLELEMAPQKVVSTDRQIRLCYPHRQSGKQKSAISSYLLASP